MRQRIVAHYVLNLLQAAGTPTQRAALAARFNLSTDLQVLKEQSLDETWLKYQSLYRYLQHGEEPLDDEIPWL